MPSCPTTIKERDRAANIKNCSKLATQQNCSNVLDYHCVINGFGNETLEVCATKRLIDGDVYALIYILYSKSFFVSLYKIVLVLFNELLIFFLGFCTEFNVAGGVIQSHSSAPCNKMTFPKCNIHYYSSEAFKCKIPYLVFLIIYLTLVSMVYISLTCVHHSGDQMSSRSVFARPFELCLELLSQS